MHQSMELAEAERDSVTLWLGGLPDELLGSEEEEARAFVAQLCGQFGAVLAASVRLKPDKPRGSWALVTYEKSGAVQLAVARGITAAVDGEEVELRVVAADVEQELQKRDTTGYLGTGFLGTAGYLAHIDHVHTERRRQAATKIQAVQRGRAQRRTLKSEELRQKRASSSEKHALAHAAAHQKLDAVLSSSGGWPLAVFHTSAAPFYRDEQALMLMLRKCCCSKQPLARNRPVQLATHPLFGLRRSTTWILSSVSDCHRWKPGRRARCRAGGETDHQGRAQVGGKHA